MFVEAAAQSGVPNVDVLGATDYYRNRCVNESAGTVDHACDCRALFSHRSTCQGTVDHANHRSVLATNVVDSGCIVTARVAKVKELVVAQHDPFCTHSGSRKPDVRGLVC